LFQFGRDKIKERRVRLLSSKEDDPRLKANTEGVEIIRQGKIMDDKKKGVLEAARLILRAAAVGYCFGFSACIKCYDKLWRRGMRELEKPAS